ncbi:MAG TPA: site-2 protease family protein [Thermohalobaculum sp.]|nr:site-2 protease family protein [Thermohalobaculum sp.]
MRWSLRLGQVGETAIHVHLTFFLLLLWVGAVGWRDGGVAAAADGVIFILLVFLCVVLHEFGHVLVARRYGIRTPDITLLPIGGVASLERMPEKPAQELAVAVAGPLVNVVIAAALILVLGARFELAEVSQLQAAQLSLAGRLAAVNVVIVLFNLIPAFPLDGGRMLRALLAMRLERARATRLAARIGQGFAVLFAALGLFGNPILLLIAVFIFFAAQAESGQEQMRAAASGYRVRDAMISRFESLGPDSTAEDAGRLLLVTTQQEFPVLTGEGGFLGMVTRAGLIAAMRDSGPTTPVRRFMESGIGSVGEHEALEAAIAKLAESPARAVAVRDRRDRFVGYVSAENATELFMLRQAREARGAG